MIKSLTQASEDVVSEADVLVIGAGIAGLLLATRLAQAGRRVVVLESGSEHQHSETHPLNEVDQRRAIYDGALHGRARCLGGTSSRWGGAMIPFLEADLDDPRWPLPWSELNAYRSAVEAIFGLPAGPYEDGALVTMTDTSLPNYVPRFAKWPAFRKRNLAVLLDAELRQPSGPDVWLDATATHFHYADDGRIAAVDAQASSGRRLTVRAREVAVTAGAIESTRLLLLADRAADGRAFGKHGVLGRYFNDHLSVRVASITPTDRIALNRVTGFRFESGGMRNLRFEPAERVDVRTAVPPGFAHILFATEGGSSFDALRDLYRQLQQRRLPDAGTLAALVRGAPWLARAAWWRVFERRLLYPEKAAIELHMVIEQEALVSNCITLSDTRLDAFGLPLAVIDWAPSDADAARLTRSTDLFLDHWKRSSLARLGYVTRRLPGEAEAELATGGGIYHPCGSTRMGRSAADGVVDAELCTFSVPNLSIAATSVFPTGCGANPTMTLMMAALRLADRLTRVTAASPSTGAVGGAGVLAAAGGGEHNG